MSVEPVLRAAIESSLEDLLAALDLRPCGEDRFAVAAPPPGGLGRVFGGQLLAQAVAGAAASVDDKEVLSLHATFVKAGTPGAPVEIVVSRIRDGRTMATRQVAVVEDGAVLLTGIATFGSSSSAPDVSPPPGPVRAADEMPPLQEWAAVSDSAAHWIEHPPAVEIRIPEAPSFLSGATATTPRSHWMRLPRAVSDDADRNAALLAYASDFFLMDMVLRMHPEALGPGRANGVSLDHVIWFHRPVHFDRWHLHTQDALALIGDRGLARGSIHDVDGRLVASVAQDVLLRIGGAP